MRQYWKAFLRNVRGLRDRIFGLAEEIWDDVEPALQDIVAAGGKTLLTLAYEAVAIAEQPNLTGEQKFKQAKKHILNGIKTEVGSVKDQTINLAIEIALAKLKRAIES